MDDSSIDMDDSSTDEDDRMSEISEEADQRKKASCYFKNNRIILRVIGNVRDKQIDTAPTDHEFHCSITTKDTHALQKCYILPTFMHLADVQYSSIPCPLTTYVRKCACTRSFCTYVTLVLNCETLVDGQSTKVLLLKNF